MSTSVILSLARFLPSEWLWMTRVERDTVVALHPQGLWLELHSETVDDYDLGTTAAEALFRAVSEGITGQVQLLISKAGDTYTVTVERVTQPCRICGREARPAVLLFRHDVKRVAPLQVRAPLCGRPECRKKTAELALKGLPGGERWTWVEGAGA